MSRYNHFSPIKYKPVPFDEINIGQKFRKDLFKGNIRRKNIIMIKTGLLSYQEIKNKKQYTIIHSDNFIVSSFDVLSNNTNPSNDTLVHGILLALIKK